MSDRKMTTDEARLGLCQRACVSAGGADSFEFCYSETVNCTYRQEALV